MVLPTDGPIVHIEMVQGDEQVGPPGAPVEDPLIVRVTDSAGSPLPGQAVIWSVSGGGGAVDRTTAGTNAEGLAFAVRILGPSPGLNVVVTAGGGSVEGAVQTTDSDGIARVDRWTLGAEPGINTLEARSGSLEGSPVIFTAEATASAPQVDRLVYRFPPPQRPQADQPFAVKVALVDAAGDVVALDGILIYLALFPEGSENPTNQFIEGSRFESTVDGLPTFEIVVTRKANIVFAPLPTICPSSVPPTFALWVRPALDLVLSGASRVRIIFRFATVPSRSRRCAAADRSCPVPGSTASHPT